MNEGLSTGQRRALADAERRLKPVRRAGSVATVNGWTVGAFGVLTALFGLHSVFLLLVGAALVAVAWNEIRGRDQLRALNPAGARRLGWNQVALLAVIATYCLGAIVRTRAAGTSSSVGQLEELAGLPPGWIADLTVTAYAAVVLVAAAFQLLMARFHFRREAMVRAHLRETPRWVLDVQMKGPARASAEPESIEEPV